MLAASSVETLNNLRASSTWLSRANGDKLIFAMDSDILTIASNCLKYRNIKQAVEYTMSCDDHVTYLIVMGMALFLDVSLSCFLVPLRIMTYWFLSLSAAASDSLGPQCLKGCG